MKSRMNKPFDFSSNTIIDGKYNITLDEYVVELYGSDYVDFFDNVFGVISPSSFETELRKAFQNTYKYYELAYNTTVEFEHEMRSIWENNKEKWEKMATVQIEMLQISPIMSGYFKTTTDVNSLITSVLDGTITSKYADTPQSKVTSIGDGYLSSISEGQQDNTTTNDSHTDSVVEMEQANKQAFELFENFKNNFETIVETAVKKFRKLFLLIY